MSLTYNSLQSSQLTYLRELFLNFSSVRRSPTMRPQQDFSRSFCSCRCPPLLSCSLLVPLGFLSHYLSTSLVVFLCFLFPPLDRIALLPVVCFPPSKGVQYVHWVMHKCIMVKAGGKIHVKYVKSR